MEIDQRGGVEKSICAWSGAAEHRQNFYAVSLKGREFCEEAIVVGVVPQMVIQCYVAGGGVEVESGENYVCGMGSVSKEGKKGDVGVVVGVSLVVEDEARGDGRRGES